ncbi:MAG TPA: hypothetical protein VFL47_15905, partial [Flavisolibacter sp.]|nr:hypothetical protein [Flavisolibacter sp.]
MRNFTSLLAFIFIFFLPVYSFAAPGNDACSNASPLTPGTTCSNTRGNLYQATNEGTVTSTCGTTSDVWYTFTVPSNAVLTTITVDMDNGNTATNANSYLEVFNANSCASVSTATSLGCSGTGSATNFTLTPGTYYCRVFTTASTTGNSGKYGFNICVTYTPVPANDECTGAVSLTSNTNCSNTASTLLYATKSSGVPAGCAPAGNLYDVWYSFVATSTAQIVTLSGLGTGITSPSIQLFSGNCGALTSVACGTTSVASGNLVIGNTYYVQVSNSGTRVTSSGNFSICVTAPTPAKVDYSKSYVNISKGTTGGTVDPG